MPAIKGYASHQGIQTWIVRAVAGMDPVMHVGLSELSAPTNTDWIEIVTASVAN